MDGTCATMIGAIQLHDLGANGVTRLGISLTRDPNGSQTAQNRK